MLRPLLDDFITKCTAQYFPATSEANCTAVLSTSWGPASHPSSLPGEGSLPLCMKRRAHCKAHETEYVSRTERSDLHFFHTDFKYFHLKLKRYLAQRNAPVARCATHAARKLRVQQTTLQNDNALAGESTPLNLFHEQQNPAKAGFLHTGI